ncbi:NitT/TauT family transport system permease protein [Methanobrevibacter gottschalkii]|uniref:NitT/TauT family transport system permease protein n=1 Tax=Methanobrevibacter gottschalkii TaxID=190974 RepID=A0A1H7HF53_9EURY|nr:ABC transporter permease [Methanobrevibacter gottschalkii]MCQ2971169.1 ABC transporter permease [archaeon]SEK48337.1 NitT/TauT family transport system permease protein [Methanobrevibacter gottschalkii]
MLDNYKNKFIPLILPVVLIFFWYIITNALALFSSYILPGPLDVVNSALVVIENGKLLTNTIDTLYKVFAGLILASIVAIPLGIVLGWYKTLEDICTFVISILRPIPPVAWIPFSILWFGIGTFPAVFIIFMGCVFPILVYTIDGVKRTDKVLVESAQTLGANDWNILRRVVLPSTIPYIVSGLKVGIGIALMCTISAEMIGSSSGLGYMILTATNLFDTGTTVVGMVVIGLIGLVFDFVFSRAQDKIFW